MALIELQASTASIRDEFQFDVRLQRRADSDPLALIGAWTLAQHFAGAIGLAGREAVRRCERSSVAEVKTLFWRYADRAELDAQLRRCSGADRADRLRLGRSGGRRSKMIQLPDRARRSTMTQARSRIDVLVIVLAALMIVVGIVLGVWRGAHGR